MMKDGEREGEIKACKEERSCETEGSAKRQEKHVRTAKLTLTQQ